MRDLAHVLAWIEQHRQRRIADRPALHLVHRIIDEEQRLAVADDEDRHALFVLEADLAGLLEAERAGEHLARAVGLGELRGHRVDRPQILNGRSSWRARGCTSGSIWGGDIS